MKVSAVVTAYNVSKWIKKCVKSVLDSKDVDLELVIVEDKSTDNTLSIIEGFADKRIKLIKNKENMGAGMSRRIGIQNSTGDYVITIDGDDFISDSFLHDLMQKAEETNADIVSGGVSVMNDDGSFQITGYGEKDVTGPYKISKFFGENIVFLNNKIVRRSLYDEVEYCGRRYIEDTQTVAPLLYLANKTVYTNNCGYFYYQRSSSLCHTADNYKNVLFRALCALDLWNWFEDKEPIYQMYFGRHMFGKYMQMMDNLNPSSEDKRKYPNEWIEYEDGVKKFKETEPKKGKLSNLTESKLINNETHKREDTAVGMGEQSL